MGFRRHVTGIQDIVCVYCGRGRTTHRTESRGRNNSDHVDNRSWAIIGFVQVLVSTYLLITNLI